MLGRRIGRGGDRDFPTLTFFAIGGRTSRLFREKDCVGGWCWGGVLLLIMDFVG